MKILFQGDSITDAGRTSNDSLIFGRGYPLLVSAEIGCDYARKYEFVNRGIGGNRITDLYARIKKDIINIKPDLMSILIGVNDVWREFGDEPDGVDADKYYNIYDMLINEVKTALPDIKIMIMEPFVLKGSGTEDNWEEFLKGVRERGDKAKEISEKHNLKFVPLQAKFDEVSKHTPNDYWLEDGVHPTPMGHELIKREWLKAFYEYMLKPSNLYIIGDSLADTYSEINYPIQGWGTFLGDHFKNEMTVHNRSRNGWSTKTYRTVGENADYPDKCYWDVIKSEFKAGDWLLIALGINDCSLTNKFRTTEEEYKENLTLFTYEAREKGVNVLFITQSIKGGDDNSESGWEYILPSDGIPIDDNIPMEQRWVRRAKVLTDIGADIDVPVIQFGKCLSEYYESMYQKYMSTNSESTVVDGRNHVRYHFHLYNKNINAPVEEGGFGLNIPDKEDDSTHININGAREYAEIIANLILESNIELSNYISPTIQGPLN